jgi:carbon-monoxide dehydrogenase medium subunit
MFPNPFDYAAASSVDEAISLLQEHGDEAKLLAGGHSLIPLMKLRLATPSTLIDIARVPDLAGVQTDDGSIVLGALTTYTSLIDSPELTRLCPLIPETAEQVGDMQVRNRGTVGGAVAHADPASDMPAAMLALEAIFTLQGPNGERTVAAGDFFQGPFTTALQPEEVLTRINLQKRGDRTGMAYEKFRSPASGYAIVGIAVVATIGDGGILDDVRIGVTGAGPQPARATAAEEALRGQTPDDGLISAVAERASDGLDFSGDIHASQDYRAHLVRVYTRRALQRALQRARG